MPDISGWWYFLIYVSGIFVAPFAIWLVWFLGMFSYGYFAGNKLDEEDLNYFNALGDESFTGLNIILGWICWPVGVPLATLIASIIIICSIFCGLFGSVNITFATLTAAINRSVERRDNARWEAKQKLKEQKTNE